MAARRNNRGKSSKPSDAQSRFSTPHKKRVVEPLENVDNDVRFSHLSVGCSKEEANLILDVNSNRKLSKTSYSGATNLSSPSILSHFSSVNHSKDKPVDYCGNHSIEGHPCQNYDSKDISMTCSQQIEVKPKVSYDTHSMFHRHHHSNHSMDRSPNHHSNYSADKLASHEDTNSVNDVQGNSNGHNNDLFYYKGIKTQNDIKRCDENVWKVQSNGEELKLTSSHASVKMKQKTKEGCLTSPRNRCQQIKTFVAPAHQTRTSPILKWEETIAACNSQEKSSSGVESINTGLLMMPSNSHVYRDDPIDQTSDGNVTPPCEKNITDDRQLPTGESKEEKRAAVMEIYICSICEKEFRQSGNFLTHMKSHTASLHYCKCGNCGSVFDSDEKLLQHMQKEHTGSYPYKCEHCDRKFGQLNNLRRHLRVHKEKIFKCRLCDRKFNEAFYLTMHMGSHTGHRTYSCGVCTSEFTSSSDLKNHVKNHPISELHVCDVCGKGFSKACVLRQHKKAHTGERPYKCEQCHKTFIHRHHLTMHMRSHTETKPFTCKTCGKEFSQTSHLNKHSRQHLSEAKLSDSSPEESNGRDEKVISTLGDNSIPDKLNGEPSNLQQKPKAKPVRKRSRGPRKKVVSAASSAYLHHASQISKANPFQSDSLDPCMYGPLSNEATPNFMKQMMNFPPPGHPTHRNPMYMAYVQAFMAAYCKNLYMMSYLSHSENGDDSVKDLSLPKRNQFSYESPMPLSHNRDSSPTVNSARNTPISSASMVKEHNQYFHNSTFTRPVEFSNYNMPVPLNGHFDVSLPTTQGRSKYGSIGENDVEDLSWRGSLSRGTAVEDRKLENCRKLKVKDEKVDELKEEAYTEEKQVEDNVSQSEISCLKQQIEKVREMIQRENQKEIIDTMSDIEEEEEEGRLMIVEQDTEIQAHNNKTSYAEKADIEKKYSGVCQNKIFSQRIQHDWKRNTFRRDTLQRSQIRSICCNKSVVGGECIHGTYEEKAIQQVSADVRMVNSVETSRSHTAVQTNNPFDILRPTETLPFQRVVTDLDFKDSSGRGLDVSEKHSPAEKEQIHRKQEGDEKSACPACLAPMDTDSDLFEHLAASMQCYRLYIAKKLRESASSPSEETVLKLAKKYACHGLRDEGIYVSQSDLEEPMDLSDKGSSKIKTRTIFKM